MLDFCFTFFKSLFFDFFLRIHDFRAFEHASDLHVILQTRHAVET